MIRLLTALLIAVPVLAATNPLEADFPDGYWDREVGIYAGRGSTTYVVNIAVEDPAKARREVEAALRVPGSKLTMFSDQSAANYQVANARMAGMMRMRPVYNIGYQLPEAKAAAVARKLIGLGRLINYNVQTPFTNPQMKEVDDRIEWLEKELKNSAAALKTMPVSRALLESKLKRLKAGREASLASAGTSTISVQITKEDEEDEEHPEGASPAP